LSGKRLAVLTGAGMSTESGIPDYRGPETQRRARKPIRFQEYAASAEGRARYWARSMLGWPRFSRAEPHAGHHALVELERCGHVLGVITQNVDGLHQAAGAHDVVELHGNLDAVVCLQCGTVSGRQELAEALNPHMGHAQAALARTAMRTWSLARRFSGGQLSQLRWRAEAQRRVFGESVPRGECIRCQLGRRGRCVAGAR
jgi:NAD-dependent SIR2 family protein deacetylase